MAIRLKSYSDYLSTIGGLIGVPVDRLSTEMAEVLRVNWNSGLNRVWTYLPWLDLCPYGEARFVGNKFTYPNDLSQSSYWTTNAVTVTANSVINPLDGRTTACTVMETATDAAHGVIHEPVAIVPSTNYVFSAYIRPFGRNYAYLSINDGDQDHYCFFNLSSGGTVGTASNATGSIQNIGSGFYLCSMSFTTSANATITTGYISDSASNHFVDDLGNTITSVSGITIQASTDGSTLSYVGDTSKGLYVWGALLQQTTNTGRQDSLVAFDQAGESRMEAVFQVWKDSPFNAAYPRELGYSLTPSGIQVISGNVVTYPVVTSGGQAISSTPQSNPVFIYYRKQMPDFSGDVYDSTDSYSVGDQVYFTNSDGDGDYYECIAAASAGDTPETDTDKWSKLEIPEALFYPATMYAYSDWLLSDGQADKSASALTMAELRLADAGERESRQMARDALPMRVSTHTTSQFRT